MRRAGLAVAITVLVAIWWAYPFDGTKPEPPAAVTRHAQIGVSGTGLTLDGRPWWPIGMNAYQLGTNWHVNVGCGAEVNLDDYFGRLPPHSLTRFNVFSSLAVNKATGALDFSALDAVFAAAARHRQFLVAVLSASEGACEAGGFKEHDWYVEGWRSAVPDGAPMPFATWLDTAVSRWRNSPALAGWTAVGEPEPSNCGSPQCDWQSRSCPADAGAVLRGFIDATSARIRELDPDTPIWSGRAGGDQCGSVGDDYVLVGSSPGIDVLEYHAYGDGLQVPGDPGVGLARRAEQAVALGKPLVVAEIGLPAGSCLPLEQRASSLAHIIDLQRASGTAGALFWSFVPDPRSDRCTLDIGPNDPLFRLVRG